MNKEYIFNQIKNLRRITSKCDFNQSLELQIILSGFDPKKDKIIIGKQVLLNPVKAVKIICVMSDLKHKQETIEKGYPFIDCKGVRELDDVKKKKKFIKRYDGFVASEAIIQQITKIIGKDLIKYGKFPIIVKNDDDLDDKITEVKNSVKWMFKKKHYCYNAIGHEGLKDEELVENIISSIDYIRSLLASKQKIEKAVIKFTMGPPKIII